MVDSRAEPVAFSISEYGQTRVEVHVTARTPSGDLLFDQGAVRVFEIADGLIHRFDIFGNDLRHLRQSFVIEQGAHLHRRSRIEILVDETGVHVGGSCVVVMSGQLRL